MIHSCVKKVPSLEKVEFLNKIKEGRLKGSVIAVVTQPWHLAVMLVIPRTIGDEAGGYTILNSILLPFNEY